MIHDTSEDALKTCVLWWRARQTAEDNADPGAKAMARLRMHAELRSALDGNKAWPCTSFVSLFFFKTFFHLQKRFFVHRSGLFSV